MASYSKRLHIGLIVLVVLFYLAVLLRNLNESERRSLQIREPSVAGDHVAVSLRVVAVNPASSEMTARVSFRLDGDLATNPVTPAIDLQLFLNDIRGRQEIELPRGRRIDPIQAVFSLEGNINHYPFDRYVTAIRIVVAKRSRTVPSEQTPTGTAGKKAAGPPSEIESSVFVAAPQQSEPLPILSSIAASIPGLKFKGQRVEGSSPGVEGFDLIVRRADNVIVVSILIMVLMMSLAMSVLLMSLQTLASSEKIDLLPLSLSIALLFGLPALRNAQPAVPALGAFGDYLSFIWAEQLVAVAAVILMWTWLLRRHRAKPEG
jgi:hypothetical protein